MQLQGLATRSVYANRDMAVRENLREKKNRKTYDRSEAKVRLRIYHDSYAADEVLALQIHCIIYTLVVWYS